jgi:hypothetical protein
MAAQYNYQDEEPGRSGIRWGWMLLAAFIMVAAAGAAVLVWLLFNWFSPAGPEPPVVVTPADTPLALITTSATPLPSDTPAAALPPTAAPTTAVPPSPLPPTPIPPSPVPPTPLPHTPVPPTLTPACVYSMGFVADVTIPDNTIIQPGTGFVKTWRIRNNGTCAWPFGTNWAFDGGNQMGGPAAVPAPAAIPGQVVDVSVYLIAPAAPGTHTGYWTLRLPDGQSVRQRYYVRIVVPAAPTAVPPTPTTTPPPPSAYWQAEYFSNPNLSGTPVVVRSDETINFSWGLGAPAPNVPVDGFSARWTRIITIPNAGAYQFFATADDGVRIWVNNSLIMDEWHGATNQTYIAQTSLAAGNHTVRVEYYEDWGEARIRVWWQAGATFPDWQGEYWANVSLSGTPTLVRNDPAIDFEWGTGSPAANLPADNFSARWTRTVNFSAGNYRFTAEVDDGLRLYVGQTLVINAWQDGNRRQVTGDIWLDAGSHPIRVEYYERTGQAVAHLNWQLLTEFPDWRGEYWPNPNLSGLPALVRNDPAVAFDWAYGSPAPVIPADGFSARWTREFDLAAGTYRLYARADDGVRVYVDNELFINHWSQSSGTTTYTADVNLAAGRHTIVVEYFEELLLAKVQFWFELIAP